MKSTWDWDPDEELRLLRWRREWRNPMLATLSEPEPDVTTLPGYGHGYNDGYCDAEQAAMHGV